MRRRWKGEISIKLFSSLCKNISQHLHVFGHTSSQNVWLLERDVIYGRIHSDPENSGLRYELRSYSDPKGANKITIVDSPTPSHPTINPFACYITILVHALICSRDVYGNAVYKDLSSTNTSKLQADLNAVAPLIGGIAKFSHTSSFIRNSFHRLPIRQRFQFNICSLMINCLTGSAPQYLKAYYIPTSSTTIIVPSSAFVSGPQ